MVNIAQLIDDSIKQLEAVSDSARLDTELLLCSILKKDRSFLRAWPEYEIDPQQLNAFQQLLKQRLQGMPIAHILGERGFWSLNLKVTPDTLIPRPDTEKLVELALAMIPDNTPWQILDLGTGTGAIALSIAKEKPACHVTATDQSAAALGLAKQNAELNQVSNTSFVQSNWFAELQNQAFDMIVSNPPYIKEHDPHLIKGDVRFEPITALSSGEDGLNDIRTIINNSQAHLNAKGALLIEHGYDQAEAVCALLNNAGFATVEDVKDDSGNPRVAVACCK
ncbi:MAG: peptide chain release factor N(5)-glutamine methyltransferase [Gammaproteobacteria bacterium]|nr:MAG: peptide chain release factor N(5)-glutamine methyltransferase [Gammaproteobacteria bacterium]